MVFVPIFTLFVVAAKCQNRHPLPLSVGNNEKRLAEVRSRSLALEPRSSPMHIDNGLIDIRSVDGVYNFWSVCSTVRTHLHTHTAVCVRAR